jgi:hypothetical protein
MYSMAAAVEQVLEVAQPQQILHVQVAVELFLQVVLLRPQQLCARLHQQLAAHNKVDLVLVIQLQQILRAVAVAVAVTLVAVAVTATQIFLMAEAVADQVT